MRYVANNTSIPVPKVQQVWHQDDVTYITMDIVDGEELHFAWHDMSDKKKRWVVEQLKGYLGQLRALKSPIEGAVVSVTGGPMRDGSRVWPRNIWSISEPRRFPPVSPRGRSRHTNGDIRKNDI